MEFQHTPKTFVWSTTNASWQNTLQIQPSLKCLKNQNYKINYIHLWFSFTKNQDYINQTRPSMLLYSALITHKSTFSLLVIILSELLNSHKQLSVRSVLRISGPGDTKLSNLHFDNSRIFSVERDKAIFLAVFQVFSPMHQIHFKKCQFLLGNKK